MQLGIRHIWQQAVAPNCCKYPSKKVQNQVVGSQRSQKSGIHSPASLQTWLPDTTPLGYLELVPGLTHRAVKLPQLETREQMKAGKKGQDRESVFKSSIERETSHDTEQRQTHRKAQSPVSDSGSTGELDHGK